MTLITEFGTAGEAVHLMFRVPVSVELPSRPVQVPVFLVFVPVAPTIVPVTAPLVMVSWVPPAAVQPFNVAETDVVSGPRCSRCCPASARTSPYR